ncbi:flagellar basal body P-ring biosynthesis protein FlgA [Neoasaia chiangmaiensis NBRC 101099]|uniref:Uncharacterized protein n=1 Tax=Neoasaia chiangmaiensis TaxID=320497 RepID=A0A1U9KR63_9PROT|nr:flagellar basal body P-ring formation chaperone FlgA [Neoasaia chiangmaiensis]AQS88318.1 hypothetical protein A0U93_10600 [Neoasaia chiangmaiensis]GBR39556.1 flagellar basal body P-ring biosynthesis protein FlgA [Neoasaia chiangmaiensis NBRC 101099]GEN14638.1 hypothetical protein NCH01_10690 [Neoasaia chiangmaiensis]
MAAKIHLRVLGLLATLGAAPAGAATLHTEVVLHGDKVRLSDLFGGLPPGQDATLGDAPELGKSYTVGGPQLTAIAAQYGVDWPEASPLVSTTVIHGARTYGRNDIVRLLRNALHLPENDTDIELSNFTPIVVSLDAGATPRLTHISYTPNISGHFSALLAFDLPTPTEFHLVGDVTRSTQVVVLRHAIRQGDPVLPENVTLVMMREDGLADDTLHDATEALGLTARGTIGAGSPVGARQLVHPMLIRKNMPVVMSYNTPSMHVTVSGLALESGGRDDMIRALNPGTRMVVTGRIVDHSVIEVIPGMVPTPFDNHSGTAHDF